MEEKIREHVHGLFEAYPPDVRIIELRDEMVSDLTEKYRDLLKKGFHEQEAYQKIIADIGNIDELIHSLGPMPSRAGKKEKWNVNAALRNAVATSVVPVYLLISFFTGAWGYTWILFLMVPFFYCAIELLQSSFAPEASLGNGPSDDEAPFDLKKMKLMKNLIISGILPFYFIVSFLTDWWSVTWVVFLLIPVLESVYRGLKSE